jgi:Family of unknown function (DUF6065)
MSSTAQSVIEFTCEPDDLDVIAAPVRARAAIPDWFRRLPGVDAERLSATNNALTVKRCMPFLDALTIGWIVPLAATVRLEISDDGRSVKAGWEFDRTMVSNHGAHQVTGNPHEPRPPMKFHNYWTIRTAPGWSSLIVPAMNRPSAIVDVLSGVVETDAYTAPINFPFVATGVDGVHTLPQGTPLVQVIPFRRDEERDDGVVRAETTAEAESRRRIQRSTQAGEGWYRRSIRSSRDTRVKVGPPGDGCVAVGATRAT